MLVKGLINSITSQTQINISIPILNIDSVNAFILSYPGFSPNFGIGQTVYVEFINGSTERPIIVGSLQKDNNTGRFFDSKLNSISSNRSVKLSSNSMFNDISYSNIYNIVNLSNSVQLELENELNYIDILMSKLKDISDDIDKNKESLDVLEEDLNSINGEINKLSSLLGDKKDTSEETICGKIYNLENNLSLLQDKIGDFGEGAIFIELIDDLKNTIKSVNNANPNKNQEEISGDIEYDQVSVGTAQDEKLIWNELYKRIKNSYGVAGIMGNMFAESGLVSNNMEGYYESKYGYNDLTYTKAVDNGTYRYGSYTNAENSFANDSAGYGLIQWTYHSIKRDLYQFAKSKKASIGDVKMQIECVCAQLSGERVSTEWKNSVWNKLLNAKSVLEASNAMLLGFEKPANQGEEVQRLRASYGNEYYKRYA